jgi:hypothetical protein
MKRQPRPFTVEVKSRRRSAPARTEQTDLAVIDRPRTPERGDAIPASLPAHSGAISGVFALANSVFTSAASFGDLASTVFGLKRPEPAATLNATDAASNRPARILPSLLPANPPEKDDGQNGPKKLKQVKARATASKAPGGRRKQAAAPSLASDAQLVVPPVPAAFLHPSPAEAPKSTLLRARPSVQPTRIRARGEKTLPRSEKWKRRLPPVCR